MKTVFYNGRFLLPEGVQTGIYLSVENGIISDISSTPPQTADSVIDLDGKYLSPGFIDIHTHGAGGHDFMDATEEAMKGACLTHLRHGTTSIVPTTLTCTNDELFTFFSVYRAVKNNWDDGPNLLGIHLEGPFFSPLQAGAQDPHYLQLPREEYYLPILQAGGENIVRVSAAVELDGALNLGKELRARGILASIGHSDADYSQVCEAVNAGYTHLTHFYSGMSSLHRVGPYRVLGVVESGYLLDELSIEIIADGKHLPPELLRLIVKLKGIDNITLITDSMRGAGRPEGEYVRLGSLTKGQEVRIQDGVAMMPDGKAFAGSVCTADRCVRTMVRMAGVSIPDAVRMMTENPAKLLKLQHKKGSLAPGMDADLVVFDDAIQVHSVYVGGALRYSSECR